MVPGAYYALLAAFGVAYSHLRLTDKMDFAGALTWAGIAFVVFLLFAALWSHLFVRRYQFESGENGFQVQSGVIFRSLVTIPYDRIQNVDIYQGPILSLFNLRELRIQTAGAAIAQRGKLAEGTITGLTPARAEQLRSELLARSKKGAGI